METDLQRERKMGLQGGDIGSPVSGTSDLKTKNSRSISYNNI